MEFQPRARLERIVPDRSAQGLLEAIDQRPAVGMVDVARGEVAHLLVFDRDQVAADGPVVGTQADAQGRGLQWGPAGVNDERVVAEQAQGGHVTGRRQRGRHVVGAADDSRACDAVHVGWPRRLPA